MRLRHPLRALARGFAPGALILMYHRVAAMTLDPFLLRVTPEHFGEHLEILRRHARPMRLRDLVQAVGEGKVPPRAVVVTCDDGYADNLLNAKPLLEQHDVPATVFVASGQPRSGREFWWDELGQIIMRPGPLPQAMEATVRHSLSGRRPAQAAWRWEVAVGKHGGWNGEWQTDPDLRECLYVALNQFVRALSDRQRRQLLEQLRAQAGLDLTCRSTHRVLSVAELAALTESQLIEVGAHSVTHSFLPALPVPEQRDEIVRSKAELQDMLGREVKHFAYPFGRFTDATVDLVRDAGYISACAVGGEAVRRGADPLRLPRVEITDCSGDVFARRLRGWFFD